jgi:hypothetical protein
MTENFEERLLAYIYSQDGTGSYVYVNDFLKSFKITLPLLKRYLRKLESEQKVQIISSLFKLGNTIDHIHYDLDNLPIKARLLDNGIRIIEKIKKELNIPNNRKVHLILKYLNECHDLDTTRYEFRSDEIRLNCFNNLISQKETNFLCRTLIDNNDVDDLNTGKELNMGLVSIGFKGKTEDAFLSDKYFNGHDDFRTTLNINEINQTITGSNLSQFNSIDKNSYLKQEIHPTPKENKILWKILIPIIVTVIAAIIVYFILGK